MTNPAAEFLIEALELLKSAFVANINPEIEESITDVIEATREILNEMNIRG